MNAGAMGPRLRGDDSVIVVCVVPATYFTVALALCLSGSSANTFAAAA